ncbi:MAG TPA: MBL fold metallo-hydrolase [Polyangiaceae bacterium]|nr:MBL fold metallo-hydrolase [Polyangiaceae bacterium]
MSKFEKSPPVTIGMLAALASLVACAAPAATPPLGSNSVTSAVHSEPSQDALLSDKTVKVSDHVWAIIGWPNIGIVVGANATLVVDTGLGQRNGATVAKAARDLAPHNRIFLTTTHFHPEHAGGALGFPPETLLIRN